jgi:hypothetical protein
LGASVTLWEATAPVKLPPWHGPLARCRAKGEDPHRTRVVFHRCLPQARKPRFAGSHLSYARAALAQCQAAVKLHGVFLSCRG